MTKKDYDRYKAKGLCVRCCKKPADNGHVMCKDCLEISRKVSKDNFEWYKENGFCYRCGKNKLFGDERTCPECRAKGVVATQNSRIRNYGSMHEYYLNKREKYIAEGKCVRCGKPVVEGLKYCRPCLDREKARHKRDRLLGKAKKYDIPRSERYSYGLCYICGKSLDTDKRLCSACCEKAKARFHGKHGKNYWKFDNNFVFGGVSHG